MHWALGSRTLESCRATAQPLHMVRAAMRAAVRFSPAVPRCSRRGCSRRRWFVPHRICSKPRSRTSTSLRVAYPLPIGTDRSLTFRELARAVYSDMGRLAADLREELEVTKLYDPVLGTTTAATHIATLEVDPDTYTVTLDRYIVVEDCGRVINPAIVDGQVHGAVAQGIGAALYEEIVYDEAG